ncbi:hypothetical protein [Brevundimonas sp. GCM10030266]|uniref:hypothetical protein n=1 Tax=Brevundimonas sp. GCM10030266 TaxID=3273386 RepID=UPI00361E8C2E
MTEPAAQTHRLVVAPADTGWILKVDGAANPMVFASGRVAEKAGRDLALRLASAGAEVQLDLRLKGGAIAARFICFPPTEGENAPLMFETPPAPFRMDRTAA